MTHSTICIMSILVVELKGVNLSNLEVRSYNMEKKVTKIVWIVIKVCFCQLLGPLVRQTREPRKLLPSSISSFR